MSVKVVEEFNVKKSYDLIVCGGGVAGVAAALTAKKRGKSVLLIEKSIVLGGLSTLGLVNYFVPMCNRRGKQIIFGMAEEWFHDSAKYGWDTTGQGWSETDAPDAPKGKKNRHFSAYIFALQLLEKVHDAKIDLLLDTVVSSAVMEKNICKGVIVQNKSGRQYYECKMLLDTTGDADVIRLSGVPHEVGRNYYAYFSYLATLDLCKKAVEENNIKYIYGDIHGGNINLRGVNQPAGVPLWSGVTVEDVTDYIVTNHLEMLRQIKETADQRNSRDIISIPMMPQFRTTCHLKGDTVFEEKNVYKHFDDSVCAINDFSKADALFEVRLGCLTRKDYPNVLAAGRCVSATGYGWDIIRVIPPSIITGQCAAEAACLAIEENRAAADVTIKTLQERLEKEDNIMVHFPDELVPADFSVQTIIDNEER